jgi:colanic acid/amylovoran biosynthesis glycosyltransferase
MIAYLSNEFPCEVEPYVMEEVEELRRYGLEVFILSIKRPKNVRQNSTKLSAETLYFSPFNLWAALQAFLLLFHPALIHIYIRILWQGKESMGLRLRALAHTGLGAYYGAILRNKNIEHIHVHHGYFGAWVAMVAAQLLNIHYSMTLHGSDLLLHAAYLDVKLRNCKSCFTISNFNRDYILGHYPETSAAKIVVTRMGVDVPPPSMSQPVPSEKLRLLSIGRLHPVKDHAFLIHACHLLKEQKCKFICTIVGEGPEHAALEKLIREFDLSSEITLAGQVPHQELTHYYEPSDLVVLTSRSEGIPLALMEAMVHKKVVLAPNITGIPELVISEKTGFLYPPGSLDDFVRSVLEIKHRMHHLDPMRRAAREYVNRHFNREKNLAAFAELFLTQLEEREARDASPVLQQI